MNNRLNVGPFKFIISVSFLLLLIWACKEDQGDKSADQGGKTSNTAVQADKKKGLFEKVPASQSGIQFSNNLQEDVATIENLFDFDYFYNGGGVGIEDINNDGLPDLFFAGNQVENKLYLNKGNFEFEDISEKAAINVNKIWSNGVTFVDINADGWMDIYVSQGGPKRDYDRSNLLYINQGDLSFVESASEYGLDDNGISTQSVFFDYDKDGDLDCFVSNENEFYGLDPLRFFNQMKVRKADLVKSSGHLYENRDGKFTDVTEKAGLLSASFGLGVTVSDINNDGWSDIYVANDYFVPDGLYINDQDGTFTNRIKEYTKQITFFGMGVDVADINNDKLQDIFVLDMASSDHVRSKTLMASMDTKRFSLLVDHFEMPYQYMFNSMQLNAGNNTFHNVAQLSKISKTDWSWAGLLVDLDLDGLKDIYVTNGYRRYALDNDSRIMVTQAKQAYQGNVPVDIKKKLYDALPSEKLSNIMYHNVDDLHFKNETGKWGFLEPSFSNGASYADLDNDGDMDLVVNNIDEVAFLYKNTAVDKKVGNYLKVITEGNTSEDFAKVTLEYDGKAQFVEAKRVKGYLSATSPDAIFGLGETEMIDVVRVEWPSTGKMEERYEVSANQTLTFSESKASAPSDSETNIQPIFEKMPSALGIDFTHKENQYDDFVKEILLPYKQSTIGPAIAKGDVNGDGLDDIFVGGAAGQSGQIFLQTSSGFSRKSSSVISADSASEDMEALFFDADQDGDKDLYVVSGGNEFEAGSDLYTDRLYINDGSGNFSRSGDETINSLKYSGKTVAALDYDEDGDLDLVVGNRILPQKYPMPSSSYILTNNGGVFKEITADIAPGYSDFGVVNKVLATDFNTDGKIDFIAVAEWGGIGMFRNEGGTFTNVAASAGIGNIKGLWFSVSETDVNNDGQKDYIIGNMGTNIKFKASMDKPFKVFGADFDDNGTYDLVLSKTYMGKEVPVRGRECSSQQMPFITEKFETYNSFANASLQDIYGDKLSTAYSAEINSLESVVLINQGDGTFNLDSLPSDAQKFPLLSAEFQDLNNDGYEDAILLGNIYNTEVETPRMDMGSGLVLLGGEKGYSVMPAQSSGLYFEGNAKAIIQIEHNGRGKSILLGAVNNGPVQVYELNQ